VPYLFYRCQIPSSRPRDIRSQCSASPESMVTVAIPSQLRDAKPSPDLFFFRRNTQSCRPASAPFKRNSLPRPKSVMRRRPSPG